MFFLRGGVKVFEGGLDVYCIWVFFCVLLLGIFFLLIFFGEFVVGICGF